MSAADRLLRVFAGRAGSAEADGEAKYRRKSPAWWNGIRAAVAPGAHLWQRVVLRVLALLGVIVWVVAWSFASPIGASPDEDFHLTSTWCLEAGAGSSCKTAYLADGTPMVLSYEAFTQPCFAHLPQVSAACQDLGLEKAYTFRINNGLYPPAYYRALHLLSSDSVAASVLAMRVANGLIFVIGMAAVYALATSHVRHVMGLTLATTIVPVGIFMIASVNPSSWAISGIVIQLFAGLAAASAIRTPQRITLAVLSVAGALIASNARGDAGAYTVVVALVLTWQTFPLWWRKHPWLPLVLLAAAVPGVLSFLSSGQTQGVGASGFSTNHRVSNLLEILQLPLGNLGAGALGRLGWLDTSMPAATWGPMVLALGFVVVLGVATMRLQLAPAALGVFVLLVGLPYYMLQRSDFQVGEFLQARYVLPLLILLVGLLLYRTDAGERGFQVRHSWAIIGMLAVIANAAALYANLLRYTNGSSTDILGDELEWWWSLPVHPVSLWLAGALGFGVGAFLLLRDSEGWAITAVRPGRRVFE